MVVSSLIFTSVVLLSKDLTAAVFTRIHEKALVIKDEDQATVSTVFGSTTHTFVMLLMNGKIASRLEIGRSSPIRMAIIGTSLQGCAPMDVCSFMAVKSVSRVAVSVVALLVGEAAISVVAADSISKTTAGLEMGRSFVTKLTTFANMLARLFMMIQNINFWWMDCLMG